MIFPFALTCRARIEHLQWTPADTLLMVPDPALVPAQGVLLPLLALAPALLPVEGVPGTVTDPLLLQAGTLAGSILLYLQGGTGLGTQAGRQPTGGQQDGDLQGGGAGGDAALGWSVATTSTPLDFYELWGHLEKYNIVIICLRRTTCDTS